MDEPFSALDPLIRNHLQDELIELQNNLKRTIIFVSHDLDEAFKLGDRIAIMEGGRVVQCGTPREIYSAPASKYVADFVNHMNPLSVLTAMDVMTKTVKSTASKKGINFDMKVGDILEQLSKSNTPIDVEKDGKIIGNVTRQSVIEKLANSD